MENPTSDVNHITLSDLIKGMQYCVNSSAEMLEQHYVQTLKKFFHEDGSLITQTIRLQNHIEIEIPLICLCSHSNLELDEMHIKTQLNLNDMHSKNMETELTYEDQKYKFSRGSFLVSLGNVHKDNDNNSLTEIELTFKRKDAPEAVARLVDQINSIVKPRESEDRV